MQDYEKVILIETLNILALVFACYHGSSISNIHPTSRFMFMQLFLRADINECESEEDLCHPNATCENTNGSYECACNSGFQGDGITNCSSEFLLLNVS